MATLFRKKTNNFMELIQDYNHWLLKADVNIKSEENISSICYVLENLTSNSEFIVTRNNIGTIFLRTVNSETLLYFKQQEEITNFISYLKLTKSNILNDN